MKKIVTVSVIAVVLLVVVTVLFQCFYTVAENEFACIVRFSKIIDTQSEPGLYFKLPFFDSIKTFPKTMLFYDIPPSEVLTLDKKSMTVDSYITWEITDPLLFYQTLSTTAAAENRLYDTTYNAFKTKMGVLNQSDIINDAPADDRNAIYEEIRLEVREKSNSFGINVIDVKMKRLDLPAENEEAVYTRMISERKRDAEQYRAEGEKEATQMRTQVDRDVNVALSDARATAEKTIAEGEAEYMRILAEAYDTPDKRAFYEFTLSLDALKASVNGANKTIILGSDSPISRALLNAYKTEAEQTPVVPEPSQPVVAS